jgi:hypothetical protein
MAANDMTDALKHSQPDVPFTQVGDETIKVMSQLAEILKYKFQKHLAPELVQAPLKAAENKQPTALVQPILTSPMKHNYQTRSQRPSNVNQSRNSPLLTRVVTPVMRYAASPTVPAQTNNLSPRNLSQDGFWDMGNANQENALGTNHWNNFHFVNAVVHPVTGNEMEYTALMKDPVFQPLWKREFGNEVGCLFKGIHNIQGTKTCFLLSSKASQRKDKSHMKKLCVTISLPKMKKNASGSQWVATGWIILAKWQPPL